MTKQKNKNWNQERFHCCECDSVSAPSAFGKHELVWGRGGYAVTNLRSQLLWVRSTALPETARGGEGGEDTAHGRTLRSIMAPIGLKAVVGESKIIMLILLDYWGLMFNHMYVLFMVPCRCMCQECSSAFSSPWMRLVVSLPLCWTRRTLLWGCCGCALCISGAWHE